MRERLAAGLLDTSVVIDLERIPLDRLPVQVSISSITMAELSAGPMASDDPHERARRQDRLQRAESVFEPIPFGTEAARAYGRVYAAVVDSGRQPRRRLADLLIAAVAIAEGLPLFTRNAEDFAGLNDLLTVVSVDNGWPPGHGIVPLDERHTLTVDGTSAFAPLRPRGRAPQSPDHQDRLE